MRIFDYCRGHPQRQLALRPRERTLKIALDLERDLGLCSYYLNCSPTCIVGEDFCGILGGGTSSVGRASPCQGEGRGFETRVPLQANQGVAA
jgi:hypothetical protein